VAQGEGPEFQLQYHKKKKKKKEERRRRKLLQVLLRFPVFFLYVSLEIEMAPYTLPKLRFGISLPLHYDIPLQT
jgi:hypothetical protein